MAQAAGYKGLERIAALVLADISHGAVGTGTTAPATSDTQLVTETDRIATTKAIRNGNSFQARFFFTNANLPATVQEVEAVLNGSGSANSGSLLVRGTVTFAKGTGDLMLIVEGKITAS